MNFRTPFQAAAKLTVDQQNALALSAQAGCDVSRDALVRAMAPLAVKVCQTTVPWAEGELADDMVAAALCGLAASIDKFDETRGALATCAWQHMTLEVRRLAQAQSAMAGVTTTRKGRTLWRHLGAVKNALRRQGAEVTAEACALALAEHDITAEDVSAYEMALTVGSLDAPVGSDDGAESVGSMVPGSFPSPEVLCIAKDLRAKRKAILDRMEFSERESVVLKARILASKPMTLRDVGALIGASHVTAATVERQILDRVSRAFGHLDAGAIQMAEKPCKAQIEAADRADAMRRQATREALIRTRREVKKNSRRF